MNTPWKIAFIFIIVIAETACHTSNNPENSVPSQIDSKNFSVKDFAPLTNWHDLYKDNRDVKIINLDFENAFNTGFIIPTNKQTPGGKFVFSFKIKNNSSSSEKFYYKIYYQNESYKFDEFDSLTKKEHPLATENFYGSWENTDITFKSTDIIAADGDFHLVTDSIRLVGNPRNETRYFEGNINNRWKRNPRVGLYSFMLVVCTKNAADQVPDFIKNISMKHGENFKTPYYFFLHTDFLKKENLIAVKSNEQLKVIAHPDLGGGLYIDMFDFPNQQPKPFFCPNCGTDSSLYNNAPFAQMVQEVRNDLSFENIPVIKDVVGDNYTKAEYNWNKNFYSKKELIKVTTEAAKFPCRTVYSDSINHKIVIKNPRAEYGKWLKERVGIISRHGLTYGKWRVKCKLTELLSKDGVWSGMTNAIWLIAQPGSREWNNRRICNKEGYMATYWGGDNDNRVPYNVYSEIDFEILKTVPYCPNDIFPPMYKSPVRNKNNVNDWNAKLPEDVAKDDGKIIVACTNWDMACPQPENYQAGCSELEYDGRVFNSHRWHKNYRALTQKSSESDDELFASNYYYFEIDWQPDKIIWRIGPEPDKMRIVGYMDDKVTMIPNNQMCLIITQEWHNSRWWPGTPFDQWNIPFPKNDMVGEFYDFVIE
jgi:hypothetical protein